jgi:glyoxylase-like metal-dependent hydrolase (beta-lactamase superfamily II)
MTTHKIKYILKPILISIFLVVTNISSGQSGKIEVVFLGNCGLFMTDGNINIYVDFPYKSGAHGYMTYDPELLDSLHANSIFLFTHGHSDHYSRKLFKKTNQKLYGPWPVEFLMPKKRKYNLDELNALFPNFTVTEYKTKHGYSLKHLSYLIEWNKKRIFISGDAHLSDTLVSVKNLDLVFAAPWVLADAWERKLKIDTKQIVLYHHRSVESINNESDKIIVPQQNQEFELK